MLESSSKFKNGIVEASKSAFSTLRLLSVQNHSLFIYLATDSTTHIGPDAKWHALPIEDGFTSVISRHQLFVELNGRRRRGT